MTVTEIKQILVGLFGARIFYFNPWNITFYVPSIRSSDLNRLVEEYCVKDVQILASDKTQICVRINLHFQLEMQE